MPRYTVHVRGEWLAVPCKDAQLTVGWLGREAVRRYIKNKPDNGGFASVDDVHFLVRRCKGLGLLDNEDPLEVALEDNEFVEVGEWPEGRCANGYSTHPGRLGCHPHLLAVQVLLGLWGPSILTHPTEKGSGGGGRSIHLLQQGNRLPEDATY